ncbi:MAG: restriction endonuclease [Clostridiales bacterium]|nr:restriction endonuclease [Clostridiales bacterium]
MAKKKTKRRSLILAALDGLLSMIDWLCESVAGAAVALLRAVFWGLWRLVCGAARLVIALGRAILSVPVWVMRKLTAPKNGAARCLKLDGPEFEAYVALVLEDNGFKHVEITKGSGDQGVDILAERNGKSYAIQCKNYEGAVGNFAVQEAYTGAQFYGCEKAAVICPGAFTRGARELAQSTGVLLWDGKKLSHMMRISGRKPRHKG